MNELRDHPAGDGREAVRKLAAGNWREESRRRELFDDNPHPMWIYDAVTLRFLEVNAAAVGAYGYFRDEFLRMTLKDIRPREDIPDLLDAVADPPDGPEEAGIWRHRARDGRILHVDIVSCMMEFRDRPARIVRALDVTRRLGLEEEREAQTEQAVMLRAADLQRLSEQLRASEARFRRVTLAMADALWEWDLETDAVWWREGVTPLFGYSEDWLKAPEKAAWTERIHPEDREPVVGQLRDLVEGHADRWEGTYRFFRDDESWVVVLGRAAVVRRDGTPTHLVGDIRIMDPQ